MKTRTHPSECRTLLAAGAVALAVSAITNLAQSPPNLHIDHPANSKVRLSWTNVPGAIVLEETDSLSPGNAWRRVEQIPTLSNGQLSLTVDFFGGNRFFRLHNLQPD